MRGGTYGWQAADGDSSRRLDQHRVLHAGLGARNTRLGNNPFVMAVPRAKGHLVLDMAMSQYSYGKLQVTRLKGAQLPFPGGFDSDGQLTVEPGPIEQSMRILPSATGRARASRSCSTRWPPYSPKASLPTTSTRWDAAAAVAVRKSSSRSIPANSADRRSLTRVADGVVDYVKSSTRAEDAIEVRYPGEAQLRMRAEQRAHGIVVDDGVWADVLALAGRTH